MRKKICALFILLGLLGPSLAVVGSAPVYAVDVFQACSNGAGSTDVCKDAKSQSGNPFTNALKIVLSVLALIVGIAAIISLIVGGIKFITAQGDASAVKNARDTIVYSLIGLIVAALAQAIVTFVLRRL